MGDTPEMIKLRHIGNYLTADTANVKKVDKVKVFGYWALGLALAKVSK